MERDKLEDEVQRGLGHMGGDQLHEGLRRLRLVRTIVQVTVGALPFVDPSRSPEVSTQVCHALKRLGVDSPEAIEFLGWDSSTSDLLADIPELAKPVHARWFIDTLRREAPVAISNAVQLSRNASHASSGKGGQLLLGGLDQRPGPHAIVQLTGGGLQWDGRIFMPLAVDLLLHQEKVLLASRPPWWRLFLAKLKSELHRSDLLELKEQLLAWECVDDRCSLPILLYLPAIGGAHQTEGHPGQFWEIGPVHSSLAQSSPIFASYALWPVGTQAFARKMVYCSDRTQCLVNLAYFAPTVVNSQKLTPWLSSDFRQESGFLFGNLFDASGSLLENRPGLGSSLDAVRSVIMKRTLSSIHRMADLAALEVAGLLDDVDEMDQDWGYQLLVQHELLNTLLPQPITNTFQFWQSGEKTFWGYRKTHLVVQRKVDEEAAQVKGKSVYRTEWYDGFVLHLTLASQDGATAGLLRRLKWGNPYGDKHGEKEASRAREPACLTLLDAGSCPPTSTAGRLLAVLRRLAPETEILFWTNARIESPFADVECPINSIQIPFLELTFRPMTVRLQGEAQSRTRYACDELSHMWLVEDCEQHPVLQQHSEGLRHGVWLESNEHECSLLLPYVKISRLELKRCKMSTECESCLHSKL